MTQIIEISKALWLVVGEPCGWGDEEVFSTLRDDAGGETLIDHAEIPALIEALNTVKDITWNGDSPQKSP